MAASGEWTAPGYTEVRALGSGGSGRVVLAVHDPTGTPVAIKYLSAELRTRPGFLTGFQEEARVMVELTDPHVARLYEYVQDGRGSAAIVMEAVNGVSLRALLREHGPTGPEAALAVLKGSLLGLSAAHRLGVVHRDYKPENVLVREDGSSKLVDFGIAVREGEGRAPAGTPPYMAPEQWDGLPASPASDVYAATAVFFECLTGHRPYQATAHVVLRFQHRTAPVPIGDVPEPVRGLVAAGMAKDPLDRPGTASAFLAELERVARAGYGADWEERGRRRLAGLAALLAALLPLPPHPPVVPGGGSTVFRTVLRDLGRTARGNAVRLGAAAGAVAVAAGVTAYALASDEAPAQRIGIVAAAPARSPGPAPGPSDPPEPAPAVTGTPPADPPPLELLPAGPAVPPEAGVPQQPATTSPGPATPKPATSKPASPKPRPSKPGPSKPQAPGPATSAPETAAPEPGTPGPGTGGPTASPSAPAASPTPSPTASPAPPRTRVSALRLGELSQDGTTLGGDVTVTTTGTGAVRLEAVFTVDGAPVRTERVTLRGATGYTRSFLHTFGETPCDTPIGIRVTAGGRTAGREVRVPCPSGVRTLEVLRAAVGGKGEAAATVATTTFGAEPVELRVALSLGEGGDLAQVVRLAGETAYTSTVTFPVGRVPCGTAWRVTATTTPAAPGGAAVASGTTPDCQEEGEVPPRSVEGEVNPIK
ncbi:hypothetical protein Misp01_74730 [Microtetraspora sp. NBRC 13810]|uniref:serine/threonine-protein kinase n=1 Tax=Microtetraspora sp. NBRC 13810 TaxID=3030990 RepID=UPI0024A508B0|nr:serine/threonine protein kinase [Microtetraspora sp. NBRC 13810]GLW12345.1 hypothetical protein Misp01_74730 [Microtetraspora sp. NBRC 13810]